MPRRHMKILTPPGNPTGSTVWFRIDLLNPKQMFGSAEPECICPSQPATGQHPISGQIHPLNRRRII